MKRLITGLLLCLYFQASGQQTYLDSSFNHTGILALNQAGGDDRPAVSLTRPDGKSIQVGYAYFDNRTPAETHTSVVVTQVGPDGQPDLSFGQQGVAVLDYLKTDANAAGALLLPDGRLLVTGWYLNANTGPHHYIACLLADGSPDPAFGENGVAGHPDPDLVLRGHALAVQPDGKIILGGSKFTFIPPGSGYFEPALARFDAHGAVDTAFGDNGLVVAAFATEAVSVAVAPDGNIYAGGSISNLARFLPDGAPDEMFGTGGVAQVPNPGGIRQIILQGDGRIVVAGAKKGSLSKAFIRRLHTDGALDNSFADAGIVAGSSMCGMATDPDGNIVVGTVQDITLRLFRYLPDGQLDAAFEHNTQLPAGFWPFTGLSLQTDGKILIGGEYTNDFAWLDFALFRLDADLLPDPGFGQDALALQNGGSNQSMATSILIDEQQRVIAGGFASYTDVTSIVNLPVEHRVGFVSRFTPDGTPDHTFSGDGLAPLPQNPVILQRMCRQSDGKILMAGASEITFSYAAFGVTRLLPDGSPDNTFGPYTNGYTEIMLPDDVYEAYITMADIAPDGAIIVAGKILDAAGARRIVVARFDADGWPDNNFGTGGVVYIDLIPGNFQLNAGLVQPDGKILLGGTYPSPVPNIFLLRLLSDGVPDPDFGANGVVLKPFTGSVYYLNTLAVQDDGKILLGGSLSGGASSAVMAGRLLSNGLKDPGFSGDGVWTFNTGVAEGINALSTDAAGNILAAGYSAGSTDPLQNNPLLLRLLPDGVPDSSFGGAGYVISDLPGDNQLTALAIGADSSYTAAGYSDNDYLMMRYLGKLSVGIADVPGLQTELLVYPNPIQGQTTLEYSLTAPAQVRIELFDMQGKRCHSFVAGDTRGAGEHRETLAFPRTLMPGMYVLRVATERGAVAVRVLVQ